jgi:hypothetical protein
MAPSGMHLVHLDLEKLQPILKPAILLVPKHWTPLIGLSLAPKAFSIQAIRAHGRWPYVTILITSTAYDKHPKLAQLTTFIQRLTSEFSKRWHEEAHHSCKTPIVSQRQI